MNPIDFSYLLFRRGIYRLSEPVSGRILLMAMALFRLNEQHMSLKKYLFSFALVLTFCIGAIPYSQAQSQCSILPDVDLSGLDTFYCITDPPVVMTGVPAGGTFSGSGVTGSVFDPAAAGPGSHTISYSITSYSLDTTSSSFAPDTASGTSVVLGDDQVSGALPIGFSFDFFGTTYTNFYISSNGFITFTSTFASGCCNGQFFPDAGIPNNLIAFAWNDLFPPGGGTVEYFTSGVAPNRKLVMKFTDIPECCGTIPAVTSQVVLYETTNIIEIHSTTITTLFGGTQGIENVDGSIAHVVDGRNNDFWSANNDFVRFTPDSCVFVDSFVVNVSADPAIIDLSATCLNLDTTFEFGSTSDTLTIFNTGCDTLFISNITTTLSEYIPTPTSDTIAPGDSSTVVVTFSPTSVGSFPDSLKLMTNVGDTAICLTGFSLDAPEAALNPTALSVTITECNDSTTVPLTIINNGDGDLIYKLRGEDTFDSTQTQFFTFSGASTFHSFTEIGCSDSLYLTITLNGDFDGSSEYAELYIDGDYQGIIPDGNLSNGTDIIVNYAFGGTQVETWLADGDLDIEVDNTGSVNTGFGGNLDFHRVQAVIPNSVVPSWLIIPTTSDTLTGPDSTMISMKFNALNLVSGTYTTNLVLVSNDPVTPNIILPCTLNLIGAPELTISDTCLELDSIIEFNTTSDTVTVYNTGCDTLEITSITLIDTVFSVDTSAYTILPGDSVLMAVHFSPPDSGSYTDTISILSNAGDTTICLSGYAFPSPTISYQPDSIHVTLIGCDDSTTVDLTVYNSGLGDLNVSVGGLSGSSPVASSCGGPATTGHCCSMGIYNVDFNTISNSSVNGSVGYQDFTGMVTTVQAGASYPVTVTTGTSFNEHVRIWIDFNNNGTFETGEQVFESLSTFQTHTGSISIPDTAVRGVALRMRVGSEWSGNFAPEACSSVTYGQFEDYSIVVSNGISISHTADTVAFGDSTVFTLTFKASDVTSGIYLVDLILNSNDPANPSDTVDVVFNVVGAPAIGFSDTCLALDTVMEFSSSADTVTIYNTGCDTLEITSITLIDTVFSVDTNSLNILPGDSADLVVVFAPTVAGAYTDTITLLNNDADTSICLSGFAFPRPIIDIHPDTLDVTIIGCGDSVTEPLTIYNLGGSDLHVSLPGPTLFDSTLSQNFTVSGDTTTHIFGGIPVTDSITLTITINGDFDGSTEFATLIIEDSVITVLTDNNVGNGTNIINTFEFGGSDLTTWLADNLLEVRIANTFAVNPGLGGTDLHEVQLGIELPDWLQPQTTLDTVAASDSTVIGIQFNAANLAEGSYFTNLLINSNDPLTPSISVPCSLTVIGSAELAVSDSCLDLDSAMEFTSNSDTLLVINVGCDTMSVDSIVTGTTVFTADVTSFTLNPGDTQSVIVTFSPVSTGSFNDSIKIYTNVEDTTICLSGEGLPRPIVSHDPDTIQGTVNCLDSVTTTFTIYNTGLGDLEYELFGDTTEVLVLTHGVDIGGEYANTISAINQYFQKYNLTESSTTSAATLATELAGKDVCLIPEREFATLSVFTGFATTLQNFVNSGGTVIFCGSGSTQSTTMFNTGLFTGTYGGFSTSTFTVDNTTHPITDSVSATFFGSSASFYYDITNSDKQTLVSFGSFDHVVLREVGAGNVILVGPDFFAFGNDQARLIANAVKFGGSSTLPSWVSLSEQSDTLVSGDSTVITVTFNSTGLNSGVYTSQVIIASNDPLNPRDTVPIVFTVEGTAEISLSDTCLSIDSTMEFTTSQDSIQIYNDGCDTLIISNITTVGSEFSPDTTQLTILPGDSATLVVNFSPTTAGIITDTLTIFSNDVDTTICLSGIAFPRPQAVVNPDTLYVTHTGCCDSVTLDLKVFNQGATLLEWSADIIDTIGDNFDSGISSTFWATVSGQANTTCGAVSGNALYFGNNGTREAITNDLNTSGGGSIDFYIYFPTGGGSCENADAGEDVVLQYSNNGGGAWTTFVTYDEALFPAFTAVTANIPVAAQTTSTRFRWMQLTHNGSCCDHWNLDNVVITLPSNNISLTPDTGTTTFNDSSIVSVKFVGCDLDPGIDTSLIIISTNDPLNPSLPVVAIVTKDSIPDAPIVSDTSSCFGNPTPDLIALGDSIRWYSDTGLTSMVFSGDTFPTGETAIGTYVYYVTQTVDSCESDADTVTLTINVAPTQPAGKDTAACFGDPVPDLIANGTFINWYSDTGLTVLAHSGDTFVTGLSAVGVYTFYVNDSLPGCPPGPTDTVILRIDSIPAAPVVEDTTICFGDPVPDLITSGDSIRWYSDPGLTNLVNTGDTFVTGLSIAGVYTFYVTETDTFSGCESPFSSVTLTIQSSPVAPIALDTTACFGDSIPVLTAQGTDLRWYSDTALTVLVHVGDTFNTGQTAVGTYTYYVTQSTSNCEGPADTATLNISTLPATPVASDTALCFGDSIPDLTAVGTNLQWYSDTALSILVGAGVSFTPTDTLPGTYHYYVTQTNGGCEGPADTATLTIFSLPSTPTGIDTTICFGDPTPDLTASGSNLNWYSDANLDTLLFSGSPYVTGVSAVGNYDYFVTQVNLVTTCESEADTVFLTINQSPVAPTASDTAICLGDIVPDLTATGTDLKWYSDTALSTLVNAGNSFATGQTSVGVYTYYVTDSLPGCPEGPADTSTLTIFALPAAPVAADTAVCFGSTVPDLTATGTNLNWYSDGNLTTLEFSGTPFSTGQTNAGVYTYYVTQTDLASGCEGPADTVTLTIYGIPAAPVGTDTILCFGDSVPPLTANGSNLQWFSDTALTTLVHFGDSFATGNSVVGTYVYYVTQTVNGCEGPADTVVQQIQSLPTAPVASDTAICFGETVPDLTATGTNLSWYSDSALTVLVNTGTTFSTGQTSAGTYTYYVTQTVSGCEGPADTSTLVIKSLPAAPVASDTLICFGNPTPDLIASGTNVNWYSDTLVSTLLFSGSTYVTGVSAVGTYNYYTTQTVDGCLSPFDTVTLQINPVPAVPVALDTAICFGDTVPDLTASGSLPRWYSDTALSSLLFSGSSFASGDSLPGTYTYYVTDSLPGCPASSPDTATLTIHALPGIPTGIDTTICFGDPTPDLQASGTALNWYSDTGLTSLVFSGNPFPSGNTAAGTYTYYVTQTVNGCEGPADTVILVIQTPPSTPVATDTAICFGEPTPDLVATGNAPSWYSDTALTSLVFNGSPYSTGIVAVGTYNFFVTDSVFGCPPSSADTATLIIHPTPAIPTGTDTTLCFGDSVPDLNASGTNLQWYSDTALSVLVNTGISFNSGDSLPGVYSYYVTQTINGCEGPADTITLTILALPIAPIALDSTICFGDTVPDLTASGSNLQWYSDTGLTSLVFTGNNFPTGQSAVGVYNFYVTQTINGCEGLADTATLTTLSLPVAPAADDTTICFGDVTPDLIGNGSNLTWYSDSTLTSMVHVGDTFVSGNTAVGTYVYYLTQTVNGCEGPADTVTLTILPLPSAPVGTDTAICFGDVVPDLTAAGSDISWYSDTALSVPVHSGNTYSTGLTTAGTYNFFVTQTQNGCEGPVDTVTLIIQALPSGPIAGDTSLCLGQTPVTLTTAGTGISWYADTALSTLLQSGNSFTPVDSLVGSYAYFVTQTINGCEGPVDTVTLIIQALPSGPIAGDTSLCLGQTPVTLTTAGTGISWYADTALSTLLQSGNSFTPVDSLVGSYAYFVTQTINGCEGPADTATLLIKPLPTSPLTADTAICLGDSVPSLIAAGTSINWYSDSSLTSLVFSGDTFATGDSLAGIFTYYVTQTVNGCEGPADSATLTIFSLPTPPLTNDTIICLGDSVPPLIASGSNIQWYSDTGLTNLVFSGDTFSTGDTAAGTYTYYMTQSVNGCEGPADSATLTIQALPTSPTTSDTAICAGDSVPGLVAIGNSISWYSDANLSSLVFTGDTLITADSLPGNYTYYATQTVGGCEGPADSATLTIHALPAIPGTADSAICLGDSVPALIASGSNINWYSDVNLTNLVFAGDTFSTGDTLPGSYTYYATQTVNGCEGAADSATLTIHALPNPPVSNDTAICLGDSVPSLIALGSNINWYSDSALTSLVFAGDTFATGNTLPGNYTYYITQTTNGCEGPADSVTLTIYSLPFAPTLTDTAVCSGDSVPALIGFGNTLQWYSDTGLTSLVFVGDTFHTGNTAAGVYDYYVTQTVNGCEGPADTSTLIIQALPAAPLATDTTICFGDSVPPLIASGNNLNWYSDTSLGNLVFSGDTFITGDTTPGIYNYYVTSTTNGCEGPADTATLIIQALPAPPLASDTASCLGDSVPDLIAQGNNIIWYSDSNLTTVVFGGDTFATGNSTAGVYTYYATQTVNNCEGPAQTVTLTIYALPIAPNASDTAICFGDSVPPLIASGFGIQWYSDSTLTTLVHSGDTFSTGDTASGIYNYYVTQTVNGCEGPADTATLTIQALPLAPVTVDTAICLGDSVPSLVAIGSNINWYGDTALTNLIFAGDTFTTGDTIAGIHTYYVTQTINGCEGPADSASLIIFGLPSAPLTSDTAICLGDSVPSLIASGNNINWYSDSSLTNLIFSGDTFSTGDTLSGTYNYFVTQSVNGCEGPADTATLTIKALPTAPVVADTGICFGDSVPPLIASGTNINWYSDTTLTSLIFAGDTLITGVSAAGVYPYFVTQTVNGCEGPADTATLTIQSLPSAPTTTDTAICLGDSVPSLVAMGSNINWYSDTALTNLVFAGDTFATGDTTAGIHTYYVTQTANGCEGPADSASLTIFGLPSAPLTSDTAICLGDSVPSLIASGSNISWYSDSSLTNLIFSGDTFSTGNTLSGTYNYYVTQSVNGCEGLADTVTLTIKALPTAPVVADTGICFGDSVPPLIASGTNINWYSDTALTSLLFSGDTLITGISTAGTYAYFVTQTVNGCEGPADTATLTIQSLPLAPITGDTAICLGDSVPSLVATGSNINWYSDTALSNLVFAGDTFATGDTVAGIHTYFVTQTVNGCEGPTDSASLTIFGLPTAPLTSDTAVCLGDSVPSLIATGSNINWYSDSGLTSLVFIGDTFSTGDTLAGTYTYFVTQGINGCESPADSATLTIYGLPNSPLTADTNICFGDSVPSLIATGANISWYSDKGLTSLVFSGDTFSTGDSLAGVYTYFATQTVNGCEGPSDSATLTIQALPLAPVANDTAICFGDSVPSLIAIGSNITWYSDTSLTTVAFVGDTFATGDSVIGTYTYFASQTINGCESPVDTVVLVIHGLPATPSVTDTAICAGFATPNLIYSGMNVTWYDDTLLTNIIANSDTLIPSATLPGSYPYYLTDTDTTTGCQSLVDTVIFTIDSIPVTPIVPDTAICDGDSVPPLIAPGTQIEWFSDPAATNLLFSGDTLVTGQSSPGSVTYYYTETTTGCQSPVDSVTLTIHAIPTSPFGPDSTICFGEPTPDFISTGSNIQWYSDTALTQLVHMGDTFSSSDTAVGTYFYFVTQTVNGCESPADSAWLTIDSLPFAPAAASVDLCEHAPVPPLIGLGDSIMWYSDSLLTNLINNGDTFITTDTLVGSYNYYLTQTTNGCTSPVTGITLTIFPETAPPTATDSTICFGDPTPALLGTGSTLRWYLDPTGFNFINSGPTYNSPETNVGTYHYYVTQTINNCESQPDTATLVINPAPLVTLSAYDVFLDQGDSVEITAFNAISYTWSPPQGLSNTTSAQVMAQPSTTQTYTVTGTNDLGCSNQAQVTVHIMPTGIADQEWLEGLAVFPNPNRGTFTVRFNRSASIPMKISMVNFVGQQIFEQALPANRGEFQERFNFSHLDQGVYFLRLESELGQSVLRVVIH